jgi:hypothetical protein
LNLVSSDLVCFFGFEIFEGVDWVVDGLKTLICPSSPAVKIAPI